MEDLLAQKNYSPIPAESLATNVGERCAQVRLWLEERGANLVAVSKLQPSEAIADAYALGQRHFGENYVQELVDKQAQLPADILWHFIGHLQTNKVKYIAPFVHLIHGVDSEKLLKEIDKQAAKLNRKINVLLQVHIADEETKSGWDAQELLAFVASGALTTYTNIEVKGLMGMATFTDYLQQVENEFASLKSLSQQLEPYLATTPNLSLKELSMGMSGDYPQALAQGATLIRLGTLIFGQRNR